MPDNAEERYRLIFSTFSRERIKDLARKAVAAGLASKLAKALLFIQQKLTREPLTWGDPQYRLPSLGWLIFQGYYGGFLRIQYGVDEPNRIVYVKEIRMMPGHFLERF